MLVLMVKIFFQFFLKKNIKKNILTMVWLNNFFDYVVLWNPWIYVFNEYVFLQFLILYTLFVVFKTNNYYFILFYIFLIFFYMGLYISILNLELFTAFLWLTESVVVFVSIIMLFYLNVHSNLNYINYINYSFKYFGFLILLFFIKFNLFYYEYENFLPLEFFNNYLWDNYYESLLNNKLNDFYGLFLSYYNVNSFEYLIIGFILLIASLVCVNLNKINKFNKTFNYYSLFNVFDWFYDFVKFFFLRKQNLINQNNQISYLKILKKKIKK